MPWVYILRGADQSIYIGSTDDLSAPVARHNRGRGCTFTATRTPVSLVYSEAFASRPDAIVIAGVLAALKRL